MINLSALIALVLALVSMYVWISLFFERKVKNSANFDNAFLISENLRSVPS